MKIAIISDTHLGYARFEEDTYVQAERALISASGKADIILFAGDIFDTKIPSLETMKRAVEIFRKATVPVLAIHGNHERRPKDMVNPAQLLALSAGFRLLHRESAIFEKDGQKVQILGIGSVPEEYAETAIKRAMEGFSRESGAFTVLMLHQSIKELVPGGKDELTLEYLEGLHFDLIIDGHIHERMSKLGGRFLIPGSTVITQLKQDETESRGYYLYDTESRKAEFVEIASRRFFCQKLVFDHADEHEVKLRVGQAIEGFRKTDPDCIISLRIEGTLKEGLVPGDIRVEELKDVFIENSIDMESLGARIERIRESREEKLSAKEFALKELARMTAGKITLFDSAELFEKLVAGPDETLAYLEKINKKD